MTVLSATPVDPNQASLLDLIASTHTQFGRPFAAAFRDACEMDAELNSGLVHPSRVSAILHDSIGDFCPRRFSASWAPACGPNGFLEKTDVWEPIDPTYSSGNSNKRVRCRRWRVAADEMAAAS